MRRGGTARGWGRLDLDELAAGLLAEAWRWRLELGLLALAVGGQRLLAPPLGDPFAAVVVLAGAAVIVAIGPARRLLWRGLRRGWVRRAWERAATDAGLADGPLRAPRLLCVSRIPAGDVLRVHVRRGR